MWIASEAKFVSRFKFLNTTGPAGAEPLALMNGEETIQSFGFQSPMVVPSGSAIKAK